MPRVGRKFTPTLHFCNHKTYKTFKTKLLYCMTTTPKRVVVIMRELHPKDALERSRLATFSVKKFGWFCKFCYIKK